MPQSSCSRRSRKVLVGIVVLPKAQPSHPCCVRRSEVVGSENCLDTSRRQFGPYRVAQTQIFYESRWSFALVNLKPIVPGEQPLKHSTRLGRYESNRRTCAFSIPGHVLVVPKRCVARFDQLSGDEVSDLWCTAQVMSEIPNCWEGLVILPCPTDYAFTRYLFQLAGRKLEPHYGASSLTFAIQVGHECGRCISTASQWISERAVGFGLSRTDQQLVKLCRTFTSTSFRVLSMTSSATMISTLRCVWWCERIHHVYDVILTL
jgi:hypothetical protein